MIRIILLIVLLIAGCSKPAGDELVFFRNGQTVAVKADGRKGTVLTSHASNDPDRPGNRWVVQFKSPKPKRGVMYVTEEFWTEELEKSE